MPPDVLLDGQQGELRCGCGKRARHLYAVPLDVTTGAPIYNDGITLAMCEMSKCDFEKTLEDSELAYKPIQRHDMKDFPTIAPSQQGQFHNIDSRGDDCYIGTNNFIDFKNIVHYSAFVPNKPPISFADLYGHSAYIPHVPPYVAFGVLHDRSAPISVLAQPQYLLNTFAGQVIWIIVIVGVLFNYRREILADVLESLALAADSKVKRD
ncbi:hypothetical protein F4821DRAFT_238693 [Hypoxylon rubiginosum]|uniref:Uncharacterized protein n=1 Tax=Hypoxylon rubiginosum TaxID=110542 RepID=A0ACC0D0J4_9PEZI|nr:hypothetical protein F4821DRAFT_238693 [Hypoxylon rubiginosum]